jgi:hypothetical protein
MESVCANVIVNGEWYLTDATDFHGSRISVYICEICETIKAE